MPTIGRIKVIEERHRVDKFVAIFGGGMDADNKLSPKRGNWLYMVDIETGKTIYKRQLLAGAARRRSRRRSTSTSTAISTRIYIGTTAGFLYKVDISSPGTLQNVTINTTQALPQPRLPRPTVNARSPTPAWEPFPIFNTAGRPIYLAPDRLYVARSAASPSPSAPATARTSGTSTAEEGRFYVILDDNFTAAQVLRATCPSDEADYQPIDRHRRPTPTSSADFVLNPTGQRASGWFLSLTPTSG